MYDYILGHELLIGVLLSMGADPKRKGKWGMTPIHLSGSYYS